jgi:hypothetical protein
VTLPAEQRHEFRYTVPEQGTLGFYLKSASPEKMVSRADDAAEAECSIRNPLTDLSGKSITLESDSAGGLRLGKADLERFKQQDARRACWYTYALGNLLIEVIKEDGTVLAPQPTRERFTDGYLFIGAVGDFKRGEIVTVRFASYVPTADFSSLPSLYGLYVDHRPPNPPPSDVTIDSIIAPGP